MESPSLNLAGREIGPGRPCFVIAEAGVNHNGSLELAQRLIDAAVRAGADAVKFQTFRAEALVTTTAPKAAYQRATTAAEESQYEMLRRLELSAGAHRQLIAYCRERGILFLSTPFDEASANFLDDLDVAGFKIGSGEITNWPLLEHIARKGKPVLLSTGMSYLSEVDEAVRILREAGCEQLALLHCVSNYPADPADVNLRALHTLATAFGLPVGFSDHTLGLEIPLAAVALGACIIEKHFTLDRDLPGPDHRASLEPDELQALMRGVRKVEAAMGHGRKEPAASEFDTRAVVRKSLVAARDLPAGAVLIADMVAIRRPGTGLPPAALSYVLGRTLHTAMAAGGLLGWDMFNPGEEGRQG